MSADIPKKRDNIPGRRLLPARMAEAMRVRIPDWVRAARYAGSPVHKKHPARYGFTPTPQIYPDSHLCESLAGFALSDRSPEEIFRLCGELLQEAFTRGCISKGMVNGWPSYLWAVTEHNEVAELHRQGLGQGVYYAYPLDDKQEEMFCTQIRARWNNGIEF